MKNDLETDRRLRVQERKFLFQLSKAKSEFESIAQAFDMCGNILSGKRRGNKSCYALVEKTFVRGKVFFDKVKGIKELASEACLGDNPNATKEGE